MKEMIIIMLMKVRDKRGATAIEYGLLAGLISIAIIVGAGLLGTNLNGWFNYVAGKVVAP